MCKCSYITNEGDQDNNNSTTSTSKVSLSSSTPRSTAIGRSQVLEFRSTALIAREDARSGGNTPRRFLPRIKLKRRVTISIGSTQSISSGCGSADVDEADWPPFADEDYIVFCFEEDGAFHVVMEESPRTPSQKHGEEEEIGNSKLSSQLHLNRSDRTEHNDLQANEQIMQRNESAESMECRNGSVESTDSSRLDWEEQLQDEYNPDFECSSEDRNKITPVPANRRHNLLPNKLVDEVLFPSPEPQLRRMLKIDDLLNNDNDGSSTISSENGSDTKVDHEDQLRALYETASDSATSSVSNKSDSTSNSFRFPVLEWEWIGSPIIWPRSDDQTQSDNPYMFKKEEKLHLTKHKSRRASLRCCRF